ncbi:MAG TPA: hypothetical protein VIJ00_06190 [Nakamurella sp.]
MMVSVVLVIRPRASRWELTVSTAEPPAVVVAVAGSPYGLYVQVSATVPRVAPVGSPVCGSRCSCRAPVPVSSPSVS